MSVLAKVAGFLLVGGVLGFSNNVAAQCKETAGALKSTGIQGIITSALLNKTNRTVALTIELQNLTNNIAHILSAGNLQMSSNAGAQLNISAESNINFCQRGSYDKDSLNYCMRDEANNISMYNDLGPCDSLRGTLYFTYNTSTNIEVNVGNTLNWSYRAIVRFSPADEIASDKPPSPPRIATLNFPPIPVR